MKLVTDKIKKRRRAYRRANPIESAKRKYRRVRSYKSPHAELYNSPTWAKLRAKILARDGICMTCRAAPATEVDHIRRHHGDVKLFLDERNLAGICRPCHSRKTAAERRGWQAGD